MTTNLDLAKRVSSRIEQIVSVSLKQISLDSKLAGEDLPEQLALVQGYRCALDAALLQQRHLLKVLVEFNFKAQFVGEEGEQGEDALTIDAEYVVVYKLKEGPELSARCLEHFAQTNGPYNLWPYWRELVQSATGRVGLSSIVIPVFSPPVVKVEEECDEVGGRAQE